MKKIFLMFVAVCALFACDPTHEKISNDGHITIDELKAKTTVTVDKAASGLNGNKMKVGTHDVVLTALCADGTVLSTTYQVECQEITDPLVKYYIYGADSEAEPPFTPGAWDAAAMRFSSTEGAHLPTIPDDVYFGLKTLIFDISNASGVDLKVMNGWWSNTYYDHVVWNDGLNELQITETMAKECAKGGEGRDLDLMLYGGTMTLKSVYYEE